MPRKFSELRAAKSPEWRRAVRQRTRDMLGELPLQELRRARQLSQVALAEALGATQPEISKIERRTDMYVSTLRRYIEALGGALEIAARFPEGTVRIVQFEDLEPSRVQGGWRAAASRRGRQRRHPSPAVRGREGWRFRRNSPAGTHQTLSMRSFSAPR